MGSGWYVPCLDSLIYEGCWMSFALGQPRYRSIWERYCNGVDAVVCVVVDNNCRACIVGRLGHWLPIENCASEQHVDSALQAMRYYSEGNVQVRCRRREHIIQVYIQTHKLRDRQHHERRVSRSTYRCHLYYPRHRATQQGAT